MHADTDGSLSTEDEYVELAVEVFSMLSDATRIRIILALRDQELSVNHLAEIVDKSAPAVSQHLAKLRLARIVSTRQEGAKGVLPTGERACPSVGRGRDLPGSAHVERRPSHADNGRTPRCPG